MEIKTPCYLIDLQKLKKNLYGLRQSFKSFWPNFTIGYSVKTNNLPWLISWMRANDVLAEVVSTPEYELARYVGYNDSQIILNGPNKGFEAMDNVLIGGGIVNLDSFYEIDYLHDHIDQYPNDIKVGIRINFDLELDCPGETIPGKEPGRFGFNIENGDFRKAVDKLKALSKVKIAGIHAHHSTRTKSLAVFKSITSHACKCARLCGGVEYINLGGCLFGDKPGTPSFEEYAIAITDVLRQNDISLNTKLILEPGAAIIASPVSYVCKVIGTKEVKDVRFVFTDGSKKHIAPQMNSVNFAFTTKTSFSNTICRQVVTGYTCIEMDRFLVLENETELSRGDKIIIQNVGAYTMSLAPLFIEYFPCVIVKDNDQYTVVREQWSTKEFIQKNNLYHEPVDSKPWKKG